MSFNEKILNRSNSYNFYKEGYENLLNKEKLYSQKITELENNIKMKDKDIKTLSNQLKKEKRNNKKLYQNFIEIHNLINDSHNSIINNLNDKFNSQSLREKEINYALILNDTIKDSNWLKKQNFSLNNSASNYSFMYLLYRILDEINPKNILELGLGQTSKLTTQYVNYFTDSNLMIIDDNQNWIDVFSQNLKITSNIKLIQRDTEVFTYNDTENLRYSNLEEVVNDNKFDLIIIDGPKGYFTEPYRELDYSRSNIWNLINNLSDDFVIVIDDFNRIGEKNTINHLHELLKEKDITFYNFRCMGIKEQFVVCSEKNKFITWF